VDYLLTLSLFEIFEGNFHEVFFTPDSNVDMEEAPEVWGIGSYGWCKILPARGSPYPSRSS